MTPPLKSTSALTSFENMRIGRVIICAKLDPMQEAYLQTSSRRYADYVRGHAWKRFHISRASGRLPLIESEIIQLSAAASNAIGLSCMLRATAEEAGHDCHGY